jgi:hypothetical protein
MLVSDFLSIWQTLTSDLFLGGCHTCAPVQIKHIKTRRFQTKSFSSSEIDLGTTDTAAPIIMLWILLSTMSQLASPTLAGRGHGLDGGTLFSGFCLIKFAFYWFFFTY